MVDHLLQEADAEAFADADHLDVLDDAARTIYTKKSVLTPGVRKLLTQLKAEGVRIGLASSSNTAWVKMVLDRWDIHGLFDVVLGGETFEGRGKPAPDIYVEAAKRLGVPANECVGVEDSTKGVRAVKAAGMKCIGFENGYGCKHDLSLADAVISSFDEIPSALLVALSEAKSAAGKSTTA